MSTVFLAAEWRKLIMANYEVDPAILLPYLPKYTELDYFKGKCYVSLVGFMFEKVKVKGFSIPFHTNFPEVNLRFYVKHKDGNNWKRGVVFINEIVPKRAIAWVANTLYKERYKAMEMKHAALAADGYLSIEYNWKCKGVWNAISVKALNEVNAMKTGSEEEFIFEHYFGYAKVNAQVTHEYKVTHPSWNVYPVNKYAVFCDFEKAYGKDFLFLNGREPLSIFVSEGSAISVEEKRKLHS
jgi:uncharacterized protein